MGVLKTLWYIHQAKKFNNKIISISKKRKQLREEQAKCTASSEKYADLISKESKV